MLLQTMHDIIGNPVAFFFRQLLAKPTHLSANAMAKLRRSLRASHYENKERTHLSMARRFEATLWPDCLIWLPKITALIRARPDGRSCVIVRLTSGAPAV